MGSQAIQCKPTAFGKLVKIQESENQITAMMRTTGSRFLPVAEEALFLWNSEEVGMSLLRHEIARAADENFVSPAAKAAR